VITVCVSLCVCVCVGRQIVVNIYEPQGFDNVDAHATFLSNELMPLVEKVVTENKVGATTTGPLKTFKV